MVKNLGQGSSHLIQALGFPGELIKVQIAGPIPEFSA